MVLGLPVALALVVEIKEPPFLGVEALVFDVVGGGRGGRVGWLAGFIRAGIVTGREEPRRLLESGILGV